MTGQDHATEQGAKAELLRYLQAGREALLWKLDGLSEYDLRRPMTPTGTNLLGLVKHVTGVEAGYIGAVFGPMIDDTPDWMEDDAEPNADMWANAAETQQDIVSLARRVAAHTAAVVGDLDLDAAGRVPWWPPERNEVTLHLVLLHLVAELNRHAGHADILRELIDGAAGFRSGNSNLPEGDAAWWAAYHARLEQAAREAPG